MPHRRQQLRFMERAAQRLLLIVRAQARVKDLGRHFAGKLGVEGQKDGAGAAAAQLADQLVASRTVIVGRLVCDQRRGHRQQRRWMLSQLRRHRAFQGRGQRLTAQQPIQRATGARIEKILGQELS